MQRQVSETSERSHEFYHLYSRDNDQICGSVCSGRKGKTSAVTVSGCKFVLHAS